MSLFSLTSDVSLFVLKIWFLFSLLSFTCTDELIVQGFEKNMT